MPEVAPSLQVNGKQTEVFADPIVTLVALAVAAPNRQRIIMALLFLIISVWTSLFETKAINALVLN